MRLDSDYHRYMFFLNPDDLTNLDIANGECYNQSIAQNLTFGWQGLPLSIGDTPTSINGSANHTGAASGFSNRESAGAQSLLALATAMFAAIFMFL